MTMFRLGVGSSSLWLLLLSVTCAHWTVEGERDITLQSGTVIKRASTAMGSVQGRRHLTLNYRTSHQLSDCLAIQREVRELWAEFLAPEAERQHAVEVSVWPGDSTDRALELLFEREDSGQWKEPPLFRRGCPW